MEDEKELKVEQKKKKKRYKHPLAEILLSIPFHHYQLVVVLIEEYTKLLNSNSRFQ
jgi:hypothetical protein